MNLIIDGKKALIYKNLQRILFKTPLKLRQAIHFASSAKIPNLVSCSNWKKQ